MNLKVAALYSVVAAAVSGCGTSVPQIKEPWELDPMASRQITFGIKRRIYCELKEAIINLNNNVGFGKTQKLGGKIVRYYPVPLEWGARVSLSLTVDEKGSLSPSAVLTKPLENALTSVSNAEKPIVTAQSFSVGLGSELSSSATRIEKFDSFYTIEFLNKAFREDSVCLPNNYNFWDNPSTSSPLVTSDLGLDQWIKDAAFTTRNLPSNDPRKVGAGTIPDTFSLQIKFVVVTNGSVNPTWKLVRVSNNTTGLPLFSVGRTRTHDLLITIGPPTKETTDSHLASQIAQSISANARILLQP